MSFRSDLARSIEEGRHGAARSALAALWGPLAARSLARPLRVPDGVAVVVVGGATLGGSGKTPLAIACARLLARDGLTVAFLGHAHGARPRMPRFVAASDAVSEVGDEALLAARSLEADGVRVVVAPTRQAALDLALVAERAVVVVIDGPAQLRPRPAALALLAVDAEYPWGAGHPLPRGDLRAPVEALLAACDRVVCVGEAPELSVPGRPVDRALPVSDGVWLAGRLVPWSALVNRRCALVTSLARPVRVVRALARRGVVPVLVVSDADHAGLSRRRRAQAATDAARVGASLWLASEKCATHMPPEIGGVPVATIPYALDLPAPLQHALRACRTGEPRLPPEPPAAWALP